MAAGLSVDLDRWRQEFDELMLRVGARFARVLDAASIEIHTGNQVSDAWDGQQSKEPSDDVPVRP